MSFKTRSLIFLLCVTFFYSLEESFGQSISGVINTYTAVSGVTTSCTSCPPTVCSSTITVASTAGFSVGGRVLIIQMKGASLIKTNTWTYGDVSAYNGAGNYEFATIAVGGISGLNITTEYPLKETYDPTGIVQLINVPQYTNVTVSGALTGAAWNGITGGVLAFEATGIVTLSANIVMNGLGYRGSNSLLAPVSCGGDTNMYHKNNTLQASACAPCNYVYPDAVIRRNQTNALSNNMLSGDRLMGAYKGEGIADWHTFVTTGSVIVTHTADKGRGKWGNGGGGGNNHNAGGGGGGNGGQGGMGGGARYGGGCDYGVGSYRGVGGAAMLKTASKVFMGGGGGEGHNNGGPINPGTAGGGIIIIRAASINNTGAFTISSNAIDNSLAPEGDDGTGAGGAGGSILLAVSSFTGGSTAVNAVGGKGGDFNNNNCHGVGAGGGGGYICLLTATNTTTNIAGGVNGVLTQVSNPDCVSGGFSDRNYLATPGSIGIVSTSCPAAGPGAGNILNEINCSAPLPVNMLAFDGRLRDNKIYLSWQTSFEQNSDRFEIERSLDGLIFTTIGNVKAAGNSTDLSDYNFIDDSYLVSGIAFYRLKQVDNNQGYSYSRIISVKLTAVDDGNISFFPNPVKSGDPLNVNIVAGFSSEITIKITNLLGQEVEVTEYLISDGSNQISINTSSLNKGIYLLTVMQNSKPIIRKFSVE